MDMYACIITNMCSKLLVAVYLQSFFRPPAGGRGREFFFATPVFGGQGPRSGDVTLPGLLGALPLDSWGDLCGPWLGRALWAPGKRRRDGPK